MADQTHPKRGSMWKSFKQATGINISLKSKSSLSDAASSQGPIQGKKDLVKDADMAISTNDKAGANNVTMTSQDLGEQHHENDGSEQTNADSVSSDPGKHHRSHHSKDHYGGQKHHQEKNKSSEKANVDGITSNNDIGGESEASLGVVEEKTTITTAADSSEKEIAVSAVEEPKMSVNKGSEADHGDGDVNHHQKTNAVSDNNSDTTNTNNDNPTKKKTGENAESRVTSVPTSLKEMYGLQSPVPFTASALQITQSEESTMSTTESPVNVTNTVHSKKISRKHSQLGSEEGVPLRKIDQLYDSDAGQPSECTDTYGESREVLHAPDFVSGKKNASSVNRGVKGGDLSMEEIRQLQTEIRFEDIYDPALSEEYSHSGISTREREELWKAQILDDAEAEQAAHEKEQEALALSLAQSVGLNISKTGKSGSALASSIDPEVMKDVSEMQSLAVMNLELKDAIHKQKMMHMEESKALLGEIMELQKEREYSQKMREQSFLAASAATLSGDVIAASPASYYKINPKLLLPANNNDSAESQAVNNTTSSTGTTYTNSATSSPGKRIVDDGMPQLQEEEKEGEQALQLSDLGISTTTSDMRPSIYNNNSSVKEDKAVGTNEKEEQFVLSLITTHVEEITKQLSNVSAAVQQDSKRIQSVQQGLLVHQEQVLTKEIIWNADKKNYEDVLQNLTHFADVFKKTVVDNTVLSNVKTALSERVKDLSLAHHMQSKQLKRERTQLLGRLQEVTLKQTDCEAMIQTLMIRVKDLDDQLQLCHTEKEENDHQLMKTLGDYDELSLHNTMLQQQNQKMNSRQAVLKEKEYYYSIELETLSKHVALLQKEKKDIQTQLVCYVSTQPRLLYRIEQLTELMEVLEDNYRVSHRTGLEHLVTFARDLKVRRDDMFYISSTMRTMIPNIVEKVSDYIRDHGTMVLQRQAEDLEYIKDARQFAEHLYQEHNKTQKLVKHYKQISSTLHAKYRYLCSELKKERESNSNLFTDLTKEYAANNSIQTNNDDLCSTIETHESSIKNFEVENSQQASQIDDLKQQNEMLTEQLKELKNRHEMSLESHNVQVTNLGNTIETHLSTLSDRETQNRNLVKKNIELGKELEEEKERFHGMEEEIDKVAEEKKLLHFEQEVSEQQINRLCTQVNELTATNVEQEEALVSRGQQIQSLQSSLESTQSQLMQVKEDKVHYERMSNRLGREKSELKHRYDYVNISKRQNDVSMLNNIQCNLVLEKNQRALERAVRKAKNTIEHQKGEMKLMKEAINLEARTSKEALADVKRKMAMMHQRATKREHILRQNAVQTKLTLYNTGQDLAMSNRLLGSGISYISHQKRTVLELSEKCSHLYETIRQYQIQLNVQETVLHNVMKRECVGLVQQAIDTKNERLIKVLEERDSLLTMLREVERKYNVFEVAVTDLCDKVCKCIDEPDVHNVSTNLEPLRLILELPQLFVNAFLTSDPRMAEGAPRSPMRRASSPARSPSVKYAVDTVTNNGTSNGGNASGSGRRTSISAVPPTSPAPSSLVDSARRGSLLAASPLVITTNNDGNNNLNNDDERDDSSSDYASSSASSSVLSDQPFSEIGNTSLYSGGTRVNSTRASDSRHMVPIVNRMTHILNEHISIVAWKEEYYLRNITHLRDDYESSLFTTKTVLNNVIDNIGKQIMGLEGKMVERKKAMNNQVASLTRFNHSLQRSLMCNNMDLDSLSKKLNVPLPMDALATATLNKTKREAAQEATTNIPNHLSQRRRSSTSASNSTNMRGLNYSLYPDPTPDEFLRDLYEAVVKCNDTVSVYNDFIGKVMKNHHQHVSSMIELQDRQVVDGDIHDKNSMNINELRSSSAKYLASTLYQSNNNDAGDYFSEDDEDEEDEIEVEIVDTVQSLSQLAESTNLDAINTVRKPFNIKSLQKILVRIFKDMEHSWDGEYQHSAALKNNLRESHLRRRELEQQLVGLHNSNEELRQDKLTLTHKRNELEHALYQEKQRQENPYLHAQRRGYPVGQQGTDGNLNISASNETKSMYDTQTTEYSEHLQNLHNSRREGNSVSEESLRLLQMEHERKVKMMNKQLQESEKKTKLLGQENSNKNSEVTALQQDLVNSIGKISQMEGIIVEKQRLHEQVLQQLEKAQLKSSKESKTRKQMEKLLNRVNVDVKKMSSAKSSQVYLSTTSTSSSNTGNKKAQIDVEDEDEDPDL